MDNKNSKNPSMIYCICSGEYEDKEIKYVFLNEIDRDELLDFLGEDFYIEDFIISDENVLKNAKKFSYVTCEYKEKDNKKPIFYFDIVHTNSLLNNINSINCVFEMYYGGISICLKEVIADEKELLDYISLEEKYFNKCKKYYEYVQEQLDNGVKKNDIKLEL